MSKSTSDKTTKAMARAIKLKAASAGLVVLVKDAEGKAHVIPGHDLEVVAVYDDRVKAPWIRDDLIDAGIDR